MSARPVVISEYNANTVELDSPNKLTKELEMTSPLWDGVVYVTVMGSVMSTEAFIRWFKNHVDEGVGVSL